MHCPPPWAPEGCTGGSDLKEGLQWGARVQSVRCSDSPATPVRVIVWAASAPLHIHITTQQLVRGPLLALSKGLGAVGWGCAAFVAPQPHASCCKGCIGGRHSHAQVRHALLLAVPNTTSRACHKTTEPITHQQRACMCRSVRFAKIDSKQDTTAACMSDLKDVYYYSPTTQMALR